MKREREGRGGGGGGGGRERKIERKKWRENLFLTPSQPWRIY